MAIINKDHVTKVGMQAKVTLSDFKAFILRGSVVDLAVGIVVGGAFTASVNALVKDIFTPFIGILWHNDLSTLTIPWNNSKFLVGDFLNTLLTFFIVSTIVYWFVVRPISALNALSQPGVQPATRECPYCFSSISFKAVKCAYCTADLKEEVQLTQLLPKKRMYSMKSYHERIKQRAQKQTRRGEMVQYPAASRRYLRT